VFCPFANKCNTGPRQTHDWTLEQEDEYARRQGQAQCWVREAPEICPGPFEETLDFPLKICFYAVFSAWFVAFPYGRATLAFLEDVVGLWSSP
jgi:hypothetical protein